MSNRKARRAAASSSSSSSQNQTHNSTTLSTAADIPLSQPSRAKNPKHKTLYDIAAERQASLFPQSSSSSNPSPSPTPLIPANTNLLTTKINPDGTISTSSPSSPSSSFPSTSSSSTSPNPSSPSPSPSPSDPLFTTTLYTLSLSSLYLTLSVLVHSQYAISISWPSILSSTCLAFPILFTLIHYFHPRADELWVQGLFLIGAVSAGCYLVRVTNEEPYLAVMRRAPPLGTLWVWCVVEQRLSLAVLGVAGVGAYAWGGGYGV